ncbi:MAG TPA: hypothetical protein VM370_09535 [Candidatus Thermoplasmatota archaeon]|nr:hypothetical protein [Candidatus Thermoplasmatota archaeon]
MLARLLVPLLVLGSIAPLAGAAVPSADAAAEVVGSHQAYDPSTQSFCTSSDQFTAIVSTDLTSRMSALSDGAVTIFTLHLDATQADPVNGGRACDAIDLTFTSDIAWPLQPGWNGGSFSAGCGLSGSIQAYASSLSRSFQIYFGAAPAACGLPVSQGVVAWSMTPLHPSTAAVCSPLVVTACAGVYTETFQGFGCGGSEASRLVVSAGIDLVSVQRACHYWSDGREHVVVSDGFGAAQVDTTSDSCDVIVADPFLGLVSESTACPAEVGDLIYGTDWAHVLP